jgi:hypothetical protein
VTAAEYLEQVLTAPTNDAAFAVTRVAIVAARARQISVDEWNEIWIAYDKRSRPWIYEERGGRWTGD